MRKTQTVSKPPFPLPDVITKVVPAPTEGWDAISPLASMDPKRAPILINWVPRPGWVELRAGYTPWSSLVGGSPVHSIMVYRPPPGEQMFAAMGSGIFDVTTPGSATEVVSGLTSDKWQYVNFTPANGTAVIQCVNGVDELQMYDGSNWTTPTITGFPGGLNTTDIRNIYAQKRRLWYVMTDGAGHGSTLTCFMPTDAITGVIGGSLDLGSLWTKGGSLVAMCDWTVDGGNGPNDYAVFMSSRGQVSIYSGDDPTSSTAWQLVGTFDLSPPIGLRCMSKVGSDISIITQQGVLPLSNALPFDPSADRSVAVTARIQNAMAQAAQQSSGNFGWQFITFPIQQLALLNVPIEDSQLQYQYVMNTLTGAWCQFQGWNANCFELFNDGLFFGGNDGIVNQAYVGGLDLNLPIAADMQVAFNYFDDPGRTKRMTMVQPLMVASGNISPTIAVDVDFATSTTQATLTILAFGAEWDVAIWDEDVWPAGSQVIRPWLSVQALGHALAVHMTVNVSPESNIVAIGEFDIAQFDVGQFDEGTAGAAPVLQVNAFNAVIELGGFI